MSLTHFFREKLFIWLSGIGFQIAVILLGYAFHIQKEYLLAISVIYWLLVATNFVAEFLKKRSFYNDFFKKLEQLDQKYLITEMIENPGFMEGEFLCDSLYDIDKSMKERINDVEEAQKEFKEYVELWIHEIKVPISTLSCMNYNENVDLTKQRQQLDKLSYYVEQILFLSRADNSQKDYLMKPVSLEQVVNQVIRSNKELLLGNQIRIEKHTLSETIMTDAKWLEFMVGQIVNNSVKYLVCKNEGESGALHRQEQTEQLDSQMEAPRISFRQCIHEDKIQLIIEDNGIGICQQDIPRVFEKTFTGENGRRVTGSTGMGLYICKKLCDKLGHRIWIESEEGEYTRVCLEFGKDDFYQMEKY